MRPVFVVVCILLCVLVMDVKSHLCLLNPNQRGGYNITGGGNSACFRYKSPCGGQPSGNPQFTIQSGVPYPVQFQQNLNHFSIGHPGYLELSFSPKADPQSEADFTVLSAISDFYPYFQWTQTNFSKELVALLPKDFESDHSVIRVRYVPHKPSEPIFHQCADVRVVKSSKKPQASTGSKNSKAYVVGLQYPSSTSNTNCALEVIDTDSGKSVLHYDLLFSLRGGNSPQLNPLTGKVSLLKLHNQIQFQSLIPSIVGVIGTTDKQDSVYYMATSASLGNLDSVPNILVKIQLNEQVGFPAVSYVPVSNLPSPTSHIVWLEYNPKQPTKLLAVVLVPADRSTTFQVQYLDIVTGQLSSDYVVRLPSESTFVDFLHATLDAENQILYMLRRDEDALPTELTQHLYAVDLTQAKLLRDVTLNSSQFAFSSIQYSSTYKGLLTVSAGSATITSTSIPSLYQVLVDPSTGAFSVVGNLKPPKNFSSFNRVFKGALNDAMDEDSKTFFHSVSVGPNANELVLTKANSGGVFYPNISMTKLYNTMILTK